MVAGASKQKATDLSLSSRIVVKKPRSSWKTSATVKQNKLIKGY
jgi:hypothetical protein